MTLEEFKKFIKTDEGKEAIAAIVDEQVDGLKKKNAELLGDKKTLKEDFKKLQSQIDEINEAKDKAEREAATKSGDVNKITEALEAKHKKELDKITGERDTLKSQLNTHVIGEGLTQALVKAKVSPALMDAARALIEKQFKGEVVDDNGKPIAKFDGKAVDEFVTGWTQTDTGKNFVSASSNSGGGSNGANGNGQANTATQPTNKKQMSRADFDALPPGDKIKTSQEGVTLVD